MKKWLVACFATFLFLTGAACGGNDSGGEASADLEAEVDDGSGADADAGADVDADAEADAEAAGDFECPVTLAEVEAAYAPIQFKDAEVGDADCTFIREDEIGSVAIAVVEDAGKAGYAGLLATFPAVEEIDGVGDEAAYGEGRTTFMARVGERVITVGAISMLGVGGVEDASSDELLENIEKATIAVGTKAVAKL
jgi:hypothetical protein